MPFEPSIDSESPGSSPGSGGANLVDFVSVADAAARLALINPDDLQTGDVVKQIDTGEMYRALQVDLTTEAGWEQITLEAEVAANTAKVSVDGSVVTHSDMTDAGSGAVITTLERSKLSGIEDNAKDDQTGAEIKALYEAEADTNVFDNAAQSKLATIEPSAKDDQDADEVPFLPNGDIAATDVQAAIVEVRDDTDTKLGGKQDTSEKGNADGYASLDSGGKIPTSEIPDSVFGQLEYQGTWNATTNNPTIPAASSSNLGDYYKVSVAGSTDIDGETDWKVGDWLASNGTVWDKVDNTESVPTVFGRSGAILAVSGDYDADQITETVSNKIMTSGERTKLAGIDAGATDDQTFDEVIHTGESVTIADGEDITPKITQNDVTNNPSALEVENAGTGDGIKITKGGSSQLIPDDSFRTAMRLLDSSIPPAGKLTSGMVIENLPASGSGLGFFILGNDNTIDFLGNKVYVTETVNVNGATVTMVTDPATLDVTQKIGSDFVNIVGTSDGKDGLYIVISAVGVALQVAQFPTGVPATFTNESVTATYMSPKVNFGNAVAKSSLELLTGKDGDWKALYAQAFAGASTVPIIHIESTDPLHDKPHIQIDNAGSGKDIQGAGWSIDKDGNIEIGSLDVGGSTVVDEIIDDDTMATASATTLSTSESIKAYVDLLIDATLKPFEPYDPTITGNYPITYGGGGVQKGDSFKITAAGTMGAIIVNVEDTLYALSDTPGQTDADWLAVESNRDQATESVKGVAKRASQAEAEALTDDLAMLTSLKSFQQYKAMFKTLLTPTQSEISIGQGSPQTLNTVTFNAAGTYLLSMPMIFGMGSNGEDEENFEITLVDNTATTSTNYDAQKLNAQPSGRGGTDLAIGTTVNINFEEVAWTGTLTFLVTVTTPGTVDVDIEKITGGTDDVRIGRAIYAQRIA